MNKRIQELLQKLRHAIDEALADSPSIDAIMAELEQAELIPSFTVDVELRQAPEAPSLEIGPLSLTERDEQFLRNLGIQTQELTDATGC
jgi:outer membrane protein TolC